MELFQGIDGGANYHFQFNRVPWLDALMWPAVWLASLPGIFLAVAIILVWLAWRRDWATAAWLAALLGSGWALIELARRLLPRERPDVAVAMVSSLEMDLSFPARGIFLTTLAYLACAQVMEKNCSRGSQFLTLYGIVLAWIGYLAYGQLYFSLHYVTDVLAGLALGCTWAFLARKFGPAPPSVKT